MNCKKCGNELKEGWKVCPKCGESVTDMQGEDGQGKAQKYVKKGFGAIKSILVGGISLITVIGILMMIVTGKSEEELKRELRGEKSVEDAYTFNGDGNSLLKEEEIIEVTTDDFARNAFQYDGKKIKLYTSFTILADHIVVVTDNGYMGTGWAENKPVSDENGNQVNLVMGDDGYVIGTYHADTDSIDAESIVVSVNAQDTEETVETDTSEEVTASEDTSYEYFIGASGYYMSGGTDDEYTTEINVYRKADYISLEFSSSESGYIDGYSGVVTSDTTALISEGVFELSLEWTDEGTFVIKRKGTTGNSEIDNMTDNLEYVNVDYYNAG